MKKHQGGIMALTLIISFCSIVYELMLAQYLSIILGNTVLRYSITIGLYLFSLGLGALSFVFLNKEKTASCLLAIEGILAFLGVLLPFLIFGADYGFRHLANSMEWTAPWSMLPSWVFIHGLIIVIGLLSGAELPILMEMGRQSGGETRAQRVLAVDYFGTFVGALAFPLLIYERWGLVAGAACIGGLNALAALLVLGLYPETQRPLRWGVCMGGLLLVAILLFHEASLRALLGESIFG